MSILKWKVYSTTWNELTNILFTAVKHVFAMYDRGGTGVILTRELGTVMKSLGHDVLNNELVDLMNEVDFNGEFLYFWREWNIDFSSQTTLLKNVLVYGQ